MNWSIQLGKTLEKPRLALEEEQVVQGKRGRKKEERNKKERKKEKENLPCFHHEFT